MDYEDLRNKLVEKNLKVTPQRLAVLEAMHKLDNHPAADKVIEFVRKTIPNISAAAVYNILEVFAGKGIISKVKTEKDIMRYDIITDTHHHLHGEDTDRIEDYFNEELNEILNEYFKKKNIPGFKIKDIRVHIHGKFKNK